MKNNNQIAIQHQLAEKWLNGTITPEEKQEFATWYNKNSQLPLDLGTNDQLLKEKMFGFIQQHKDQRPLSPVRRKWLYAAAAIITLGLGLILFGRDQFTPKISTERNRVFTNDVGPGGTAAQLTLSDGSTLALNPDQPRTLSGIDALSTVNGVLIYKQTGQENIAKGDNTLTTPKGGQYQLVLADGTKVYLNASSSITFPVKFSGHNRSVRLNGEAYFEVTKNKTKPFIVHTIRGNIEVLGTHFNISSYPDEPAMKATLLEGSVKITSKAGNSLLVPGDQAKIDQHIVIQKVDVDEVMAWKNQLFVFDQTPLKEIMRQLARWYDVEIVFDGSVPDGSFSGEISRNAKLSEVLKVLQTSGIHFKIDGKKVSISPE